MQLSDKDVFGMLIRSSPDSSSLRMGQNIQPLRGYFKGLFPQNSIDMGSSGF